MQATCKARTRSGARCKNPPITGAAVCRMHGGSAPAVRAAAERRVQAQAAIADAKAALAYEGVPAIEDPVLALAELAAEVRATVRALGARVNALQDVRYESAIRTEQVRTEIDLLGQYQDRLARMLTALGRFNLDERRVKLDEATAMIVFSVLDTFINRLNLPADRHDEARTIMAGVIRELDQTEQGRAA
jgi:hypothetical protein